MVDVIRISLSPGVPSLLHKSTGCKLAILHKRQYCDIILNIQSEIREAIKISRMIHILSDLFS